MKRFLPICALAAITIFSPLCAIAQPQPPLPPPAERFQSGSLLVQRFGTPGKPALIFIPGLTCGPWEWSREIARFSKDYSVYALTLPGFDGQKAIAAPLFSTVTSDVWKLFDARGLSQVTIVGHSLGGTLALALAEQHPERLAGVIAVDGLPVFPGMQDMSAAQRSAAAEQIGASFSAVKTPQQFEAMERTFVLPYLVTAPGDAAAIAALVARSDVAATEAWMREDISSDLRPALSAAKVPALEIAPYDAALDARIGPAPNSKQQLYASLLASAPHARVLIVPGARHFLMYDRPAELDDAIAAFLLQLPSHAKVPPSGEPK